jgi:hypothetical protein
MRRRSLALIAVLMVSCSSASGPFEPLRQASVQEVPGTFGFELSPVDGDLVPVDPIEPYLGLPGADEGRRVALTLATISSEAEGASWGPAWIYFTWDLCYFTAKGDFVSPSRSGLEDGCTPENMLVQIVDAETGEALAAFDAFDPGGDWLPERSGTPDQVASTTRFH